jgi:hypothetical protein
MCRIGTLLVIFYVCATWSFNQREELRLRVFENRVLRRIFGSKEMKCQDSEKIHDGMPTFVICYSSSDINTVAR